jgi:hypothetical protein
MYMCPPAPRWGSPALKSGPRMCASSHVAAGQPRQRRLEAREVYYELDADTEERADTTVAELPQLVARGVITDETMIWAQVLGDEWMPYSEACALLFAEHEGNGQDPAEPEGTPASSGAQAAAEEAEAERIAARLTGDAVVHYELDPDSEERAETTVDELLGLSARGEVTDETLIWADGMPEWTPYGTARDQGWLPGHARRTVRRPS